MEWIEDMRSKATRELNTDSAAQTEEHIERQEKYLDQMDKKKKSVLDQVSSAHSERGSQSNNKRILMGSISTSMITVKIPVPFKLQYMKFRSRFEYYILQYLSPSIILK